MAVWFALLLSIVHSWAFSFRHPSASDGKSNFGSTTLNISLAANPATFREFYYSHSTGRGLWKWSQALDAYQRHLGPLAGRQLELAEVGIQSGGSLLMWKAILGDKTRVHGVDIDPACAKFADSTTTITIGDQGDLQMWASFFSTTASQLDIFIDDGSHQPHHMGTSLQVSFPHLKPGGMVSIEDTNGQHSVQSFYCAYASKSIGAFSAQGQVASVHVYPLMLIVHKVGGDITPSIPPAAVTVDNLPALWAALPQHPGGSVAFENPSWGSFLSETVTCNLFTTFADLQSWAAHMDPPNCHGTHGGACRISLANSAVQNSVKAVHIFPTRFIVEVEEKAPVLEAVRMGTDWLPWYGHR
jgi:cephalosporin hydroxylase